MDSDRVLVLDAGRVIEFDEPYQLLQNEKGLFANMVKMTGKSMAHNLKEMARIARELREKNSNTDYNRGHLRDLKGSFINSPRKEEIIEETIVNNDDHVNHHDGENGEIENDNSKQL